MHFSELVKLVVIHVDGFRIIQHINNAVHVGGREIPALFVPEVSMLNGVEFAGNAVLLEFGTDAIIVTNFLHCAIWPVLDIGNMISGLSVRCGLVKGTILKWLT
jgi:hypothetical protein